MAKHTARGEGRRRWSGTPADLAALAREGQGIVRSASHANPVAVILVRFRGARESSYDSPEEFLAGITAADIPNVTSVMIPWIDHGAAPGTLVVSVELISGRHTPWVTATADDPSLADGAMRRVAGIFSGRAHRQGLRTDGPTRFQRMRAQAGVLFWVAVTAAITVMVTIVVSRLLSGGSAH
jgi:hypothetical protein